GPRPAIEHDADVARLDDRERRPHRRHQEEDDGEHGAARQCRRCGRPKVIRHGDPPTCRRAAARGERRGPARTAAARAAARSRLRAGGGGGSGASRAAPPAPPARAARPFRSFPPRYTPTTSRDNAAPSSGAAATEPLAVMELLIALRGFAAQGTARARTAREHSRGAARTRVRQEGPGGNFGP